MSPNSILGSAFGNVHRWWMQKPGNAALVAFACYLIIAVASGYLRIWSKFEYKKISCHATQTTVPGGTGPSSGNSTGSEPTLADGFAIWNWGFLYSFSMPLAAFMMGHYFRALDNGLLSLDGVIKPSDGSAKSFTAFLAERVQLQWSSIVFPISLVFALVLTVFADGRDIIAPLQSNVILPSCTRDWSSVGYTQGIFPALWYFAFNCAAFAMQAFLGYCGILVLSLTAVTFGTVFRFGLGSRAIVDSFRAPGTEPPPERYRPDWVWCDTRCGLGALDIVFLLFTGLSLFALVASAASIFVNVYLRHHATPGSVVLAVGTMFFIPWSAFWIFIPYFSNFPKKLPPDFEPPPTREICDTPDPWPFGSERLSWTLIAITVLFWLSLLTSLLGALFGIVKSS
jgi:hypothetical protein